MASIQLKPVLLGGIAYAVFGFIINVIGATLTMSYYTDPANFPLWSKLMMPGPGAPPAEFMIASLVIGLLIGILYAFAYGLVRPLLNGDYKRKGATFGVMLFAVTGVPYALTNWMLLAIPTGLLAYWAFETLVIQTICGVLFARLFAD
jgi:hypothetical protein